MPTTVEKFSKKVTTRAQVEQIGQDRLQAGAVSSVVSADNGDWVLTTVLPGPAPSGS